MSTYKYLSTTGLETLDNAIKEHCRQCPAVRSYYLFTGSGAGDSIVTIDGEDITIPAGEQVSGYYYDDISSFKTNNLKRIYIRGNMPATIGSTSVNNDTIEVIDISFKPLYQRSSQYFCQGLTKLKYVTLANVLPTSCYQMFYDCEALTTVTFNDVFFSACTTFYRFFYHCNALTALDLTNWDFSKVTNIHRLFYNCNKVETLTFTTFDLISVITGDESNEESDQTTYYQPFQSVSKLTDVIGEAKNIQLSLSLSSSPLTEESALVFINGLSATPLVDTPTLTLSSTTKGYLTDEDIAIATDKGWTIA